MINFTLERIRQLRGAPLSVYLVLMAAGQRVSQEFVQRHTGYTDKPVAQALAYLADLGHVDHNQTGWALVDGEQLVLGTGDVLPAEAETVSEPMPVEVVEDAGNSDTDCRSRNNSDSPLKLSKLSINTLIKDDSYLLNLSDQGRKNSDLRKNSDPVTDVLIQAGVVRKVTQELAGKVQVSAGQLRAIIWEMSQEKHYTPGLLVHRLRKSPEICQRSLTWSTKRWSEWLIDSGVAADFDLVQDLARDYKDPAEAFDKLPLSGLTVEIIEGCLWEVG